MSEGVLWDTVITPMPMDQVFKEVYSLLKSIGVSVIEEIEPVYIKGFWNGKKAGNIREYPRFAHANEQISRISETRGLRGGILSHFSSVDLLFDPFEKNIEVRIKQHTSGSSIEFEVSQVDPRHKGKGLLYWGSMLEAFYERFRVDIKQENLENLYRAQVENELKVLVKTYRLIFLCSLAIVLLLRVNGIVMLPINPWNFKQWDILWFYFFFVVFPLTYFFGARYGVYRHIKRRLR